MPDLTKLLRGTPPVEIDHSEALETWRSFRVSQGYGRQGTLLGEPGSNTKTTKNTLPTYTLSLAAARTSGKWNVCPFATPECKASCLINIGRGGEPRVVQGRILRTNFLAEHPDAFCTLVKVELLAASAKHGRIGCRLNTFSDIPWEEVAPWLLDIPNVQFYDYTKNWHRTSSERYTLTFSASERTDASAIAAKVATDDNVAVVLNIRHRPGADAQTALPALFAGSAVIDGDKHDERFADPRGVVVGLRAKGKAALLPVGGFVKAAL